MTFPKELFRITKHKKPLYQLYQPGFNPGNGCWLWGDWVTLPQAQWRLHKKSHCALYAHVQKAMLEQDHKDPEVKIENMTLAQKQAWEFFSGEPTLYHQEQDVGIIRIRTAGGKISVKDIEYARKNGTKFLRVINEQGRIINQAELYSLPDDLLVEGTEPVDPWKHIIQQNQRRHAEFSAGLAKYASESPDPGFMAGVAIQGLIEIEKEIIRAEWLQSKGRPDAFYNAEETKARYVELRGQLKASFKEQFDALYKQAKEGHNSCERTNLDNCNGVIYCYVLPEFNEDGTHKPWGPKDVPWGHKG